jgi:anti-sigma regulatory factor (Ser/Thr protein kinase)
VTTDDAWHTKRPLAWQLVAEFSPSVGPGSEHQVAKCVTGAARNLGLRPVQMERIRQTVLQALCNVTTRGSQSQPNLAVSIRIWATGVYAPDRSRSSSDATQSGQPEHHGWGFFLVQRHGDEAQASDMEPRHTIELYLYHEGARAKKQTRVKGLTDSREFSPQDRQRQRG